MKTKVFIALCLLGLAGFFTNIRAVSAHTTITVGNYQVEIGWLTEPPIVGQQNAIILNVSTGEGDADQSAEIDVSALKVDVVYGSETRALTLQPLGEDTPGQYVAPILPTLPGQYTIRLSGNLGDSSDVSAEVQPEEVKPADTLQFPVVADSSSQMIGLGLTGWLAILGILTGLAGLIVGLMALRRNR